jgi:hypothetical protein
MTTAYADYDFYIDTYLGTSIVEADFPALALRASQHIDNLTFGRAATDTDNETAIKNAMCAIAEELQRQDNADGVDGVTSETQGRYSVSYGATSSRTKSNQVKIEEIAKLWLANTYLMFSGFASGEYSGDS